MKKTAGKLSGRSAKSRHGLGWNRKRGSLTAGRDRARGVASERVETSWWAIGSLFALMLLLGWLLAGCGGLGGAQSSSSPSSIASTQSTAVSTSVATNTTPGSRATEPAVSSTTTTLPTTTTSTTAPVPAPQLMLGSKGPAVATLQQKLIDLTYQPGRADGVFDTETRQASCRPSESGRSHP